MRSVLFIAWFAVFNARLAVGVSSKTRDAGGGAWLQRSESCPLESKPLAFVVVIGNGVDEFRFGRLEKFEPHQKSPRSILAKTSAAGLDASSPRS